MHANWSAARPAEAPCVVTTCTCTTPEPWGGLVMSSLVADKTCTVRPAVEPNRTAVTWVKPGPVTVARAPPDARLEIAVIVRSTAPAAQYDRRGRRICSHTRGSS
jgi:hypothetical protein